MVQTSSVRPGDILRVLPGAFIRVGYWVLGVWGEGGLAKYLAHVLLFAVCVSHLTHVCCALCTVPHAATVHAPRRPTRLSLSCSIQLTLFYPFIHLHPKQASACRVMARCLMGSLLLMSPC